MPNENYLFSRISPKLDLSYKQIIAIGDLNPYGQHQVLWKLFDFPRQEKKEKTEFLFRFDINKENMLPVFYVLSCRQYPRDREGLWDIESKNYDPVIKEGDRLAFKLRVNPVVTRKPAEPDPNPKKRKRHDVVMEAKIRLKNEAVVREKWPHINEIIHKSGIEWLRKRGDENGFTFSNEDERREVSVDGYHTHEFYKNRARVRFSSLDFTGTLNVIDSKLFKRILFNGLGPAKAFGCGLMLVKRI
ncbi:MAG TPA: type I-E CRISPR-associated protein Cas6/Cse3/CasE [Thermodesulfobacteriota bacterium]|nr:type I-E CRISPR-associated protein Cas6/Cse3/CasE [Thermodesulfobacteriota bacterium]